MNDFGPCGRIFKDIVRGVYNGLFQFSSQSQKKRGFRDPARRTKSNIGIFEMVWFLFLAGTVRAKRFKVTGHVL